MIKQVALASLLLLTACSQGRSVFYFVPQLETAAGTVPSTKAFPLPSLEACLDLKNEFEKDMKADPNVLASHGDCIRSKMELKKPTAAPEQPGHTAYRQGSI